MEREVYFLIFRVFSVREIKKNRASNCTCKLIHQSGSFQPIYVLSVLSCFCIVDICHCSIIKEIINNRTYKHFERCRRAYSSCTDYVCCYISIKSCYFKSKFLNSFHHTCYQRYGSLSLRYAGKIIDVYDNFLVISFTGDTDNTAVVRVSCTDGIHINAACNHTAAIMICMVSDDLCSSRCCKKFCYIMMVNFCEMISYSLKTCC